MLGLGEERQSGLGRTDHQELLGVSRGHRHDGGRLSVISVDLAARRTRDIGIAILRQDGARISCRFGRGHVAALGEAPAVDPLADLLVALCKANASSALLIDGPQAWKDPANGLIHQRVCEKALATQAKTGPRGSVKPRTQRAFVEFSIALFDALDARDLARFDPARRRGCEAIEVFPTASWRALGIGPLPGKANATEADLQRRATTLADRFGMTFDSEPTHDELQAAVAGLAGLALAGHHALAFRAHGLAPFQVDGVWCEGAIGVAEPAKSSR